jgi:hypothetical protein
MAANSLLSDILQQIALARALLKGRAGDDPLHELPTLVGKKVGGV